MFNVKEISRAVEQIAEAKGLDPERVIEAIESSIAAAYKKEYMHRSELVRAKLDLKTGVLKFWQVKNVVDETMVRMPLPSEEKENDNYYNESSQREVQTSLDATSETPQLPRYNSDRHILLNEAQEIKADVLLSEEMEFPLETKEDFGRIAAQTAKQVIIQKLRDAERSSIFNEFKDKQGSIVSGVVQRMERGNVYLDLGRAVGVMFPNEAVVTEHYRLGERLRFYVLAVQDDMKLPAIVLSRSHPKFIAKLFELEVPEISDGSVQIKSIAREPGSRTKIAVASTSPGIDPVGSCVGQRGRRVMAVNNEIGQEKIDIIEWSEKPEEFVANAVSPARVTRTEVSPRREVRVYVPEDQLSLAIGRGGQNVRLAVRLTGYKIDVRSDSRPDEMQVSGVFGEAQSEDVSELKVDKDSEVEVKEEESKEVKSD